MKKWQLFLTAFLFLGLSFGTSQKVFASEGVIELKSTTAQDSRCFGVSAFLADKQFHLLLTCRNLVYPPHPLALHYFLWATPTEGGNYLRLAELGVGKVAAQTNTPFVNLFVTREADARTKQPTGDILLSGDVRPISFFEGLSPTVSQAEPAETEVAKEGEAVPETEVAKSPKKGLNFDFLTGPFAIVAIGILGLIFLLYVIFRRN